ncbi:MAG: 23S rRNA (uracil(1939)-C(5))-methyltransferase RlmD [Solobacterium sp.]|nr:23S rRNA (uracil(1939)-C(5))-methyltransferase RlmD [Solobacterium sp.]
MKRCPYARQCGGCQYQGIPYEEQLKRKQKRSEELLGSFGKVEPIIGSDPYLQYRNKAQISFMSMNKKILMGNYMTGTHRIVEIEQCELLPDLTNEIFRTIRELLLSFRLSVFNEHTMEGFLRHVLIRTDSNAEKAMVTLVTGTKIFPKKKDFLKELLRRHPQIISVIQNVNARHTSMILGDYSMVLYGKGYIEDELCGYRFRISPESFYQINHAQTEKLYASAILAADPNPQDTVLDAYCGIGTIGICLAEKVNKVIGVEINKQAIRDAGINAEINHLENTVYFAEDAGEFMRKHSKQKDIDTVIMDPPRAGADKVFLSSLVQLNPKKIVYISCNPETQKRDLQYLTARGYKVGLIQPYDLFPMTEHIESVVKLTRTRS